jgi:hypothetical protein
MMGGNHSRRIAALERRAWDRVHALPPREWIARGYVTVDALPSDERFELLVILEQSFHDGGYIDQLRLTPEQEARGGALMLKSGEIPA